MTELIFQKALIQINKCIKKCNICHYWYFLDKNFNYDPYLCNGCYDLMQKAMSFKNASIVSIKGNDYRSIFFILVKMMPLP